MPEIIIDFTESPLQRLMDYAFKKYIALENVCTTKGVSVNISQCVECCEKSYFDGTSVYECDNFKKVYIVRYLAVQVAQIELPLTAHLASYFQDRQKMSAISLGGGPGTEAIALMNQMSKLGGCLVTFENLEIESSWNKIYEDLTRTFEKEVGNIQLKSIFTPKNILVDFKTKKSYDLTFISWVVSHFTNRRDIYTVLAAAKSITKPNGYIVITDRTEANLMSNISSALETIHGLIPIGKGRSVTETEHCGITFPEDIKETFKVRIWCNSAYWIMKVASPS